jgi:adenine-specific DNA-methyltransferase
VEVTKLSLVLKVLEGENQQTLMTQLRLFQERALPDLGQNIKCGNSLISPDIYDSEQRPLLSEDEHYRVNVFDWQTEFQEVLGSGGFDAVIGNPPWGAEFTAFELAYHRQQNHEIIVRMIDSFMYFVYQGAKKLKAHGRFGMILPDVLLYQKDNAKLREFILKHFQIDVILNMGNVFEQVTRPASIIIFQRDIPAKHQMRTANLSDTSKLEKQARLANESHFGHTLQHSLSEIPSTLFITENPDRYNIWVKVNNVAHRTLAQCIDEDGIQRGASPDLKEAFIVDTKARQKYGLENYKLRRVLTGGKQVKRYVIDYPDLWIIYMTQTDNIKEVPHIQRFIDQFAHKITCKEVFQNKHSLYSLHRPRKERIFLKDQKLLGVITEDTIKVALDDAQTFVTDGLFVFAVKNDITVHYLMALLNSRLFVFVYRLLTLEEGRVLAQVKPTTLNQLPIRTINFAEPVDKWSHDQVVARVTDIITLNKHLADGKTEHEKMALQRQIHTVDRQIDQLVYQLYGLTAEEVNLVEQATR